MLTALATLALWSGLGATPPPDGGATARARFTWDVPEVVETVEVPGSMRASGVPVKLRAVRSKLPMESLLQHFVFRFQAAGLFVPPGRDQLQLLREPTLTAVDPETRRTYSVIFFPHGDEGTTVILGEADHAVGAAPDAHLPVFPGSPTPLTTTWEGGASMSYRAAAPPAEVERYYEEVLLKAGYQRSTKGTFRRRDEELRLDVRSTAEGTQVLLMQHRAPAPTESPGR